MLTEMNVMASLFRGNRNKQKPSKTAGIFHLAAQKSCLKGGVSIFGLIEDI